MSRLRHSIQSPARRTASTQRGRDQTWRTYTITLDPDGDRFRRFSAANPHLVVQPIRGIPGSTLSEEEMIRTGLATPDLIASSLLTPGRAGCTASHRRVRQEVAGSGRVGALVLEDDCITHPQIARFIDRNLSFLAGIDILLFGVNTDSILQSTSPQGLQSVQIFWPKHPEPEWIHAALATTDIGWVELHRLHKAFGLCAYFVTPRGARTLERLCLPLSMTTTPIPLVSEAMPASGLDRAQNGVYERIEAYVCQPFLAYTPNIDSSTAA